MSNRYPHFTKDYSNINSFYIYSRWCPRRNLQAAKLYRYFIANGLSPASDARKADLVIVFTCGAMNRYEKASLLTIEQSLKNKQVKTIITGCLPKINPVKIRTYDSALVIYPENLSAIDSIIQAEVPYNRFKNTGVIEGIHRLLHGGFFQRARNMLSYVSGFLKIGSSNYMSTRDLLNAKTTYKLEIAEGCLGNCSFCAIKLAMGKFRSVSEAEIISEFRSGLAKGYSEFALIAGDTGCYGLDIKTNLPNLLKKMFAEEGEYRVLLWDLNARWFIYNYRELSNVIEANPQKISRIVVPIESGSNRILKLMNRGYEIEQIMPLLSDLQERVPNIKLDTQIIVGFPGETDEDFAESLEVVEKIRFSEVAIFKYNDRPNTNASSLPHKVDKKTINSRAKILAKVSGGIVIN